MLIYCMRVELGFFFMCNWSFLRVTYLDFVIVCVCERERESELGC